MLCVNVRKYRQSLFTVVLRFHKAVPEEEEILFNCPELFLRETKLIQFSRAAPAEDEILFNCPELFL